MTAVKSKYASVQEMDAAHQKMFNEFPIGYAFGDKQIEEALARMNCTINDVVSIGAGGFIRKADVPAFKELCATIKTEEKEFRKVKKNLVDTFVYELQNHEFLYTRDITETIEACGYDFDSAKNDRFIVDCARTALKKNRY